MSKNSKPSRAIATGFRCQVSDLSFEILNSKKRGRVFKGKIRVPSPLVPRHFSLLRRVLCSNHDCQNGGPVRIFVISN
jgi:hypothetical protein